MFSLKKTSRIYQTPLTKVSEVDLEGLICGSPVMVSAEVDELHNINADSDAAASESFYFEF